MEAHLFFYRNKLSDGEANILARGYLEGYTGISFLFIFGIKRKLETFRKVQTSDDAQPVRSVSPWCYVVFHFQLSSH